MLQQRSKNSTVEAMKKKLSPTQKMLNAWAVSVIIWSLYRAYVGTSLPVWVDEFIAKPLVFLSPVYYYITQIEKKQFLPGIDFTLKKIKSHILFGLIIGGIFFATGMIMQYIKIGSIPQFPLSSVIFFSLIAFASSFSEEILSRGFVLKRLYEDSGNLMSSVFFSSFLFFFLHIPILFTNPNIYGPTLIQVMVTDLLLSFTVSLLYLQRKHVIVPILLHAFYNLSIYLFLS